MYKRGFTLFEVVLALALIAFLSVLSLSLFSTTSRISLQLETEKMHAAVLYLQRKALLEKKTQYLVLHQEQNNYVVENVHGLPQGIRFGAKKEMLGPPSRPTIPLTTAITFPRSMIACYADGTLSAGALYLTDGKDVYALTCDASEITCIRRYVYSGSWRIL